MKFIKKINKSLKKIIMFLKKHYILLILFLMIYLIKNNCREYFGGMDVTECTPKAGSYCGNETDSPETQAKNFIKNIKMQMMFFSKIIKNNFGKSDKVFEASITIGLEKFKKFAKKYKKEKKIDNSKVEEIVKYIKKKIKSNEVLQKSVKDLEIKMEIVTKKLQRFNIVPKGALSKSIGPVIVSFIPLLVKTLNEANGDKGFMNKKNYKQNGFIYFKVLLKGGDEILEMFMKHDLYKKEMYYKKKDEKK